MRGKRTGAEGQSKGASAKNLASEAGLRLRLHSVTRESSERGEQRSLRPTRPATEASHTVQGSQADAALGRALLDEQPHSSLVCGCRRQAASGELQGAMGRPANAAVIGGSWLFWALDFVGFVLLLAGASAMQQVIAGLQAEGASRGLHDAHAIAAAGALASPVCLLNQRLAASPLTIAVGARHSSVRLWRVHIRMPHPGTPAGLRGQHGRLHLQRRRRWLQRANHLQALLQASTGWTGMSCPRHACRVRGDLALRAEVLFQRCAA